MYACCRYNLFTYLVTLHTENLNERFSFLIRGCTCLKCTNKVAGAFKLVGAVLALASGKAERRQLHPLSKANSKVHIY